MLLSLFLLGVPLVSALFFGSGGGGMSGCCCGCGTPQPASCGCCPQAAPCPVCPTPQCPPPPAAYCPQVSPVYIPSCSGGSCDSGCGGGGCGGGGGGGCSGGNCGGGGGGGAGYASSGGFAAAPSYSQSTGGGYSSAPANYAAPQPVSSFAPVSPVGYAQPSGGSTASFAPAGGIFSQGTAPGPAAPPTGGSYTSAGGNFQSSYRAEDPVTAGGATAHGTPQQVFKNDKQCDGQQPVKYVVLRAKKLSGTGIEEVNEEEMEEVSRPSNIEATASPLDVNDLSEDITASLDEPGRPHKRAYEPMKAKMMFGVLYDQFAVPAKARSANTLSEAKCNSKPLKDLVLENIAKDDALLSKRQIHDASIRKFPEHSVDVICSGTGFTYLVATTEHCEAQKDNVICFVYKRPL